jgi:cobalt/nickel transport system permease protein
LETIVHIPDGFLSTPVWAALDAAAVPCVAVAARRAQRGFDDSRIPLLGVMGAFVFAAQMINFPVGVGTSGHLVGGALLAITLGPAAASVVMCAILAIQALVFQDGGLLALGANSLNMAVFGVLAGFLPFRLWGGGRFRSAAIFAAGALSVLVSAVLAMAQLLLSGVRMPGGLLGISLALFLVSGLLEGAITLAVVRALEAIQPNFVRQPASGRGLGWAALGVAAMLLAGFGFLYASTAPDGIERITASSGIVEPVRRPIPAPLAGYEAGLPGSDWTRKAAAGMAGLALVYGVCVAVGRAVRGRSA